MHEINRIQKRKVSEDIVEEIKRLIQNGSFEIGSKLPSERELSEIFGVGRSSMREALSMLAAAEIIETRQGEGTFVRKATLRNYINPIALSMVAKAEQTLQLLETRKILELGTVELAAERADEQDLKQMRSTILELELQVESARPAAEADFAFHRAIAVASKNPILIQVMENLAQVLQESLEYQLRYNEGKNAERPKYTILEHKDIYDRIEKRDSKGAIQAMKFHLDNVWLKILQSEGGSQ